MRSDARDILALLDAGAVSASVGAALELGLFWLLGDQPQPIDAIAQKLGIPPARCSYWLQILAQAGLVAAGFRVRNCDNLRLSDDSDPFMIIDAERV